MARQVGPSRFRGYVTRGFSYSPVVNGSMARVKMDIDLLSGSTEQTISISAVIGGSLAPGDVVCLTGDLGTGKTVAARGMAMGRGHEGAVVSPTFTIIRTYPDIWMCHVDAFRLEGAFELFEIGIEEYLEGDWVCVVEWADRVRAALPEDALDMRLSFGDAECERWINLKCSGELERRLEATGLVTRGGQ